MSVGVSDMGGQSSLDQQDRYTGQNRREHVEELTRQSARDSDNLTELRKGPTRNLGPESGSKKYRAEKYRAEKYRAEKYRAEMYRAEMYREEKYRAEKYRAEKYRAEKYRAEKYRAEMYRAEKYRAEKYRAEMYRAENLSKDRVNMRGTVSMSAGRTDTGQITTGIRRVTGQAIIYNKLTRILTARQQGTGTGE
ncbi:hypothetical protein Bbelb_271290 [Branchiostoma belcheri]|nr:hypothetical protein Bbelb_271290 [Branchiostoma belcheri]